MRNLSVKQQETLNQILSEDRYYKVALDDLVVAIYDSEQSDAARDRVEFLRDRKGLPVDLWYGTLPSKIHNDDEKLPYGH